MNKKFLLFLIPFFITGCGLIPLALTPITYPTQKIVEWSVRESSMNPYNNPNYVVTDECAKDIARAASQYGGLILSDDEIAKVKNLFNKKINQQIDKSWSTEDLVGVNTVRLSRWNNNELVGITKSLKENLKNSWSSDNSIENDINNKIGIIQYINSDSTIYISKQDTMNLSVDLGVAKFDPKPMDPEGFFDYIINENSNKLELVLLTVIMKGFTGDNSITGIESYHLNNCHIKGRA